MNLLSWLLPKPQPAAEAAPTTENEMATTLAAIVTDGDAILAAATPAWAALKPLVELAENFLPPPERLLVAGIEAAIANGPTLVADLKKVAADFQTAVAAFKAAQATATTPAA